ncbi:MAG: hypothetical protein IKW10_00090 [Oscillospiraceae bacterium]|nr:hypothetical protein [Oscillospiraceae bacterium]
MQKDTANLIDELKNCSDFNCFYRENENSIISLSLSQLLAMLLEKHGLKKADAIRRSELNEDYAYQIFSGLRVPERKKLLSLAIGMLLNLEEMQTLLKTAGYAQLYVKNPFDCILIYGICKKLSVADINYLLFDYGMETLG